MWAELRREICRPWKLSTFAVGLALLIVGSFYYRAPDWDIPVSIIMATFTYLTAGWSMRVIIFRQWRQWPLMLFFTGAVKTSPSGMFLAPLQGMTGMSLMLNVRSVPGAVIFTWSQASMRFASGC